MRSRNCLQKMGVMTLGDLARTSEAELLASKNFGETSLVEIREMMASKGLNSANWPSSRASRSRSSSPKSMTPDEQAVLERPIADLNLSVRARKCMVRLGINTIGELLRRTGDDLLECKNFGVTSLNEVREKLTGRNSEAPRRLTRLQRAKSKGGPAAHFRNELRLLFSSEPTARN